MSSVSFPHHQHPPPSPSSSIASHSRRTSFFPSSYDPESSQSAFQINPLSNHPPRTPRVSLMTANTSYHPDLYHDTNAQDVQEKVDGYHNVTETKQEDDASMTSSVLHSRIGQVKPIDVWKDMLASTTGRDKVLKLVQYSLKFYVVFHKTVAGDMSTRLRKPRAQAKWEQEIMSRIFSASSGLSLTRKCLLLFNWLTPLSMVMQPETLPFASPTSTKPNIEAPLMYKFLRAPPPVLLDLVNTVAEDVSTSAKLGIVRGRIGQKAGRLADWTWFAGTLVALVELSVERAVLRNMIQAVESRLYTETMEFPNGTANREGREADEKELQKLRRQLHWMRVNRLKLLMDLVFVSYDCFRIEKASEAVKAITGLASACLSSAKLYDRHRNMVLKGSTG